MSPITDPLEISALIAVLVLALGYFAYSDIRARRSLRSKNPGLYLAQIRQAKRDGRGALCFYLSRAAAFYGASWNGDSIVLRAPGFLLRWHGRLTRFSPFPSSAGSLQAG